MLKLVIGQSGSSRFFCSLQNMFTLQTSTETWSQQYSNIAKNVMKKSKSARITPIWWLPTGLSWVWSNDVSHICQRWGHCRGEYTSHILYLIPHCALNNLPQYRQQFVCVCVCSHRSMRQHSPPPPSLRKTRNLFWQPRSFEAALAAIVGAKDAFEEEPQMNLRKAQMHLWQHHLLSRQEFLIS